MDTITGRVAHDSLFFRDDGQLESHVVFIYDPEADASSIAIRDGMVIPETDGEVVASVGGVSLFRNGRLLTTVDSDAGLTHLVLWESGALRSLMTDGGAHGGAEVTRLFATALDRDGRSYAVGAGDGRGLPQVLLRVDPGETAPVVIAAAGQSLPGGGEIAGLLREAVADGGAAFLASVVGGLGAVGAYTAVGGELRALGLQGGEAPGLPGVSIADVGFLRASGTTCAFLTKLQGAGVTPENDFALYVADLALDPNPRVVLR